MKKLQHRFCGFLNRRLIIPQRASGTAARHQQYLETIFYLAPLEFELLQEPETEQALLDKR
jgi:hypothetical protein